MGIFRTRCIELAAVVDDDEPSTFDIDAAFQSAYYAMVAMEPEKRILQGTERLEIIRLCGRVTKADLSQSINRFMEVEPRVASRINMELETACRAVTLGAQPGDPKLQPYTQECDKLKIDDPRSECERDEARKFSHDQCVALYEKSGRSIESIQLDCNLDEVELLDRACGHIPRVNNRPYRVCVNSGEERYRVDEMNRCREQKAREFGIDLNLLNSLK